MTVEIVATMTTNKETEKTAEIPHLPQYLGRFTGRMVKPLPECEEYLLEFSKGDLVVVFRVKEFYSNVKEIKKIMQNIKDSGERQQATLESLKSR
jgi:uncharacterized protein (DUF3820 family)